MYVGGRRILRRQGDGRRTHGRHQARSLQDPLNYEEANWGPWSRSDIDHIVGVPWLPNPGEGGDAEDLGGGVRVMDKEYWERIRQDESTHEAIPRNLFITKDDLEEN